MLIETLVSDLSHDPFNPELNFACAVEYERLNQTASAVSFYLRTAEYGKGYLVYNSLLKLAQCFESQNDRIATVSNCILQAIAYAPERPEGYFLMSQFHERAGNWQECYTFAEIGLSFVLDDGYYEPLEAPVGYHGDYVFTFEKAVSAYWLGRRDESISLLKNLASVPMESDYEASVKSNLERIDVAL